MKNFSQRKGYKPINTQLQCEGMNDDLRNSLWNVFSVKILSIENFRQFSHTPGDARREFVRILAELLWMDFFKKTIDQIPDSTTYIIEIIKSHFFKVEWNEAYDLLEFLVQNLSRENKFVENLNSILEREFAGYRFVDNVLVDITSPQEISMLEEALQDTQFEGVTLHLKRALELLADRKNPDYRNSIKESISAVESMAQIVAEKPNATLGDALKAIEKSKKLHPALKNGFSNLYGYTNDADGVRHAMMEEPNLTAADAKFFLLSCTSFVNYLKTKM